MRPDEFARHDGTGLAALVRRREVSPTEVLDAAIGLVETRNPEINAVVARLYDQARAAIAAGLPTGPFTGVPYLLKDLGAHYAGAVTSGGGALWKDFVPDHDSELTRRLKRAGLVIIGKSNTPELGLASTTEPRLFGPTRNPWNAGHSAGGSSGGAAAAVAAGMVPMAHATDGGGSIRIPASACGLFGLKPTRARNPIGPDQGEGWGGASVAHAVTRSVRDSAALLDATAGPDVGDPYWAPPPARPFLEEVGRAPRPLRIALTTRPWNGQAVDPECEAAARDAARLCASLGHTVEEAGPTADAAALGAATLVVIGGELRAALEARAAALGRALEEADVERITWRRAMQAAHRAGRGLRAGHRHHAPHRAPGRAVLRALRRAADADHVPAAVSLGVIDMMTLDAVGYGQAVLSTIAFTRCGTPAATPRCRCRSPGRGPGCRSACSSWAASATRRRSCTSRGSWRRRSPGRTGGRPGCRGPEATPPPHPALSPCSGERGRRDGLTGRAARVE